MQLFILKDISKLEERVYYQLKNVLRAKEWYIFYIQKYYTPEENYFLRYKVRLKKDYTYEIIQKYEKKRKYKNIWVWVAFLNKFEKMELIVQKLTEIWVENIIFFLSERSIIRYISDNKIERFKKIAIEAAEQSFSYFVPNIYIYYDLSFLNNFKNIYLADLRWKKEKIKKKDSIILIWPEWWIDLWYNKIKLLDKILRSETAAILAWYLLI